MTPFRAAAVLALVLGGAWPAQAAVVTVVNPTTFGGFETAGEAAAQWTPSPGFNAATFAIGDEYPSYQGNYEGLVTTASRSVWQYIGLQNLAVQAGATITVEAYVYPNTISDAFGISYGTTGAVTVTTTPTQYYNFTIANTNSEQYIPITFTFVAPSSNIDIDFGFLDAETVSPMLIDNVWVYYNTAGSVPEPSSMALLGAALLGFGVTRRSFGWTRDMLARRARTG
jgi:hypothetical protein